MLDPEKPNKPENTPFKQQTFESFRPMLTHRWVIAIFIGVGILFIIIGAVIKNASDQIVEYSIQYDGDGTSKEYLSCMISSDNEVKLCTVTFHITENMKPPIFVYYQLTNFYQNHRRYVASRAYTQLQGIFWEQSLKTQETEKTLCKPKISTGDNKLLYPCGLIANSMFNDIFNLVNTPLIMNETEISWKQDRKKFKQVQGMLYVKYPSLHCPTSACSCQDAFGDLRHEGCQNFEDPVTNQAYKVWYPHDDTTQYLYETYPRIVNPLEGVLNEHFIVWMKPAPLPSFRKKYGIIHGEILKGSTLEFVILCQFRVDQFQGTKSLVISTTNWFGDKNHFLGVAYLVIGCICIALGITFAIKYSKNPRKPGDTTLMKWKGE